MRLSPAYTWSYRRRDSAEEVLQSWRCACSLGHEFGCCLGAGRITQLQHLQSAPPSLRQLLAFPWPDLAFFCIRLNPTKEEVSQLIPAGCRKVVAPLTNLAVI
jgi:hypothetical protein